MVGNSSEFLKAIAEPNRLRILCMLYTGCQCVGDISKRLKIPHNLVSFHLKSLVNAGLLERRREGNKSFYSIKDDKVEYVGSFLNLSK